MNKYFMKTLIICFVLISITFASAREFVSASQNIGDVKNCKAIYSDCNSKGAFLYGTSGNTVYSTSLAPNYYCRSFSVNGKLKSLCQSGEFTYALYETNLKSGEYLIAGINARTGQRVNYEFSNMSKNLRTDYFSVSGNYAYFLFSNAEFTYINVYNLSGSFFSKINFNLNITQLINNNSNTYALLDDGKIYLIDGNKQKYINTTSSPKRIYNCGIGWICGYNGQVISLLSDEVLDKSYEYGSVAVADDCVLQNQGDSVLLRYIDDQDNLRRYDVDNRIKSVLAYRNNSILIFEDYSYQIIPLSKYELLTNNTDSSLNIVSKNPTNSKVNYYVSNDIIYGIKDGTSVTDFKKSFNSDITLTDKNQNSVTSGKIKTGYNAMIDGKNYKLSVAGDITGEGNLKSNDVSLMFSYLLCECDFDELQMFSADLNNDGDIDNRDLVLISRKAEENKK